MTNSRKSIEDRTIAIIDTLTTDEATPEEMANLAYVARCYRSGIEPPRDMESQAENVLARIVLRRSPSEGNPQ